MATVHSEVSEAAILSRIFRPEVPMLSLEAAREILTLDFDPADQARMHELSAKARAGQLTAEEDAEAAKYEIVGHLLNIIQSKARRSIKSHRVDNGN